MSKNKDLQVNNLNSDDVDFDSLFDEFDIETWGVEAFGDSTMIAACEMHAGK